MTFSDSRIVKALQDDWMPVWEAVSPIREVTFELGEGREVKGTVGGEIAIYFCDEQGRVFDILPALQSPAATLEAMKRALDFYRAKGGNPQRADVVEFHRGRLRSTIEEIYAADPARFDGTVPKQGVIGAAQLLQFSGEPGQIEAKDIYPETKKNETDRQRKIKAALDQATYDMRLMVLSKTAASPASEGKITIVEPGGRGYYRWQVDQAFCGVVPDYPMILNRVNYPQDEWVETVPAEGLADLIGAAAPVAVPKRHPLGFGAWNSVLKQPRDWQRLLFEGILHQPLGGGKFKYDSESLKALSIIED